MCNKLFASLLCRPVMFSAGDEMQGLFHTAQGAYQYFAFFLDLHTLYSFVVVLALGHRISFLLIG